MRKTYINQNNYPSRNKMDVKVCLLYEGNQVIILRVRLWTIVSDVFEECKTLYTL